MATLDEIFKKEFNQSRSGLSSQGNIYDLKLPKGSLPSKDFYTVKSVDEEYYDKLNDCNVMLLPKGYPLTRRLLN